MIDEQFGYRADSTLYQSSAELLENVVIEHAGGLKQRPGLKSIGMIMNAKRLITFTSGDENNYLFILSERKIDIYTVVNGEWTIISGSGYTTDYLEEEIKEIKYAQDSERLILVQKNHPPLVITKGEGNSFNIADIVLDTETDRVDISYDDEGNEIETEHQFDYDGLFTQNNFPSVITFCANRLWFGASKEYPNRLWVSQAFKYNNFQDFAYYKVIDETVTSEQYLKALEEYTSKVEDDTQEPDLYEIRTTKEVSPDGYVIITKGKYRKDDGSLVGELSTETFNYTSPAVDWQSVTRDDSAMVLDPCLTRNEAVRWIGFVSDRIMVGTASSEWAMSYAINANNAAIYNVSSYGAAKNIPLCYGSRNIFFIQVGEKKLRSFTVNGDAPQYYDLTYQNKDILSAGVVDMTWQKIPEPRLYACLKDGSIALLCYDEDYSLNGWCKWTFDKECISVATVDTYDNQEVFALFSDGTIGVFEEDLLTDFDEYFEPVVITNYLDTMQTMISSKKGYSVNVCAGESEFLVNTYGLPLKKAQSYGHRVVRVPLTNSGDFRDGYKLEIRGIKGKPFRIHSVITTMEVLNG